MLIKKSFTCCVSFFIDFHCLSILCRHHHCRTDSLTGSKQVFFSFSPRTFLLEIYAAGICRINQLIFSSSTVDDPRHFTICSTLEWRLDAPAPATWVGGKTCTLHSAAPPPPLRVVYNKLFLEGSLSIHVRPGGRWTNAIFPHLLFTLDSLSLASCSTCAPTTTCIFPPSTFFLVCFSPRWTFSIWRHTQNKWKFHALSSHDEVKFFLLLSFFMLSRGEGEL